MSKTTLTEVALKSLIWGGVVAAVAGVAAVIVKRVQQQQDSVDSLCANCENALARLTETIVRVA